MRKFLLIAAAAIAVAAPLPATAGTSALTPWKGIWQTTCWYKMNLTQVGTHVSGYIGYYAGKVNGTTSGIGGKKWTGVFKIPSLNKTGTFVFTLGSTNHGFTGHWAYKGHASKSCTGRKIK